MDELTARHHKEIALSCGALKVTLIYLQISSELKCYMKKIIFELFLKVNVAVIYKEVPRLNTSPDNWFASALD